MAFQLFSKPFLPFFNFLKKIKATIIVEGNINPEESRLTIPKVNPKNSPFKVY
jgi:hypothetical protein